MEKALNPLCFLYLCVDDGSGASSADSGWQRWGGGVLKQKFVLSCLLPRIHFNDEGTDGRRDKVRPFASYNGMSSKLSTPAV